MPVTQELTSKLEKELLLENDSRDKSEVSTTIKDYLNNTDFKVRLAEYGCRHDLIDCSFKMYRVRKRSHLRRNTETRSNHLCLALRQDLN